MNEELIKRAENAIGIMEDSSNTTADEDYLCEIIRELLAAALSQPADGWKDISTAPRDATRILVCYEDVARGAIRVAEAWWGIPFEGALLEQGSWRINGNSVLLDKSIHGLGATNWQPLPQPPKGE